MCACKRPESLKFRCKVNTKFPLYAQNAQLIYLFLNTPKEILNTPKVILNTFGVILITFGVILITFGIILITPIVLTHRVIPL